MKISRKNAQFQPVIITIESEEELLQLHASLSVIANAYPKSDENGNLVQGKVAHITPENSDFCRKILMVVGNYMPAIEKP